jgi:hypothetical protein
MGEEFKKIISIILNPETVFIKKSAKVIVIKNDGN